MNTKRKTAAFLIFSLFSSLFAEESFRISALHILDLSPDSLIEKTAVLGINDSLCIKMPEDKTYIEGIEIRVQIPNAVSAWRDSVACSIYDDISPVPEESQIDYSGQKIFITPLPSKLSWIVKIPLKQNNSIKDNQYASKVNVIPDISKGYTFIRFQPAMKGIPEETFDAKLTVSVKPVLINKGKLDLKINPSEKKCQLFIDDEPADMNGPLLLSAGMHNVSVQSDEYRNEVRTVYIEQAKTTELVLNLKSNAPTLLVTAPSNAEVYLDGNRYTSCGKETEVSEGEHRIRFVLGGYEVIRSINVLKGKSYTADLSISLEITEE